MWLNPAICTSNQRYNASTKFLGIDLDDQLT